VTAILTEDPNPTPATHIGNNDEGVSPALDTTSTNDSRKPSDPALSAGILKSSGRSVDTSAEEDKGRMISPSRALPAQSPVDFVLGNFFLATFLISLTISIVVLIVTWFTVLRDARSMNDRVLSNATGVSLCLYHSWWTLLTVVAAVGSDTRP
jgi:hypothetical protein